MALGDGGVPFLMPGALEPYLEQASSTWQSSVQPEASAIVLIGALPAGHGPEQAGAISFPLLGQLLQPTPLPVASIGRAVFHGLAARWSCHCVSLEGRKFGPTSMGCDAPEWGRFSSVRPVGDSVFQPLPEATTQTSAGVMQCKGAKDR